MSSSARAMPVASAPMRTASGTSRRMAGVVVKSPRVRSAYRGGGSGPTVGRGVRLRGAARRCCPPWPSPASAISIVIRCYRKTMDLRDADYEDLLALRTGLRRFLRWSEQQAEAAGLTPAQHQLLLAVRGHPDRRGPTVGEVADYLLLRHHSAVGLVDRAVAPSWSSGSATPRTTGSSVCSSPRRAANASRRCRRRTSRSWAARPHAPDGVARAYATPAAARHRDRRGRRRGPGLWRSLRRLGPAGPGTAAPGTPSTSPGPRGPGAAVSVRIGASSFAMTFRAPRPTGRTSRCPRWCPRRRRCARRARPAGPGPTA